MKSTIRRSTLRALACSFCALSMATAVAAATVDRSSPSGALPYSVLGGVQLQYYSWRRTWYDVEGTILVCPIAHRAIRDRECSATHTKDDRSGWVRLQSLTRAGFTLASVQFNETRDGPTLVLYWMPNATLAKPLPAVNQNQ